MPVSLQRSSQELAYAAKGILAQVDPKVIDSLPGISVPTLVIIGAGDDYYLQGSDYMASRIPGKFIVVPDAGHGVNVDQPEIVNRAFGNSSQRSARTILKLTGRVSAFDAFNDGLQEIRPQIDTGGMTAQRKIQPRKTKTYPTSTFPATASIR